MSGTTDRRPWLIISKAEAEAILPVLRDYLDGAVQLEALDLHRAERVLSRQLAWLRHGEGRESGIADALIREMRS